MMDCDCLIRVDSLFSTFVQHLGDHNVVIIPKHVTYNEQGKVIDEVEIIQNLR